MFRATIDPCVLIQQTNDQFSGLILQVDDSMEIGTRRFLTEEYRASTK